MDGWMGIWMDGWMIGWTEGKKEGRGKWRDDGERKKGRDIQIVRKKIS